MNRWNPNRLYEFPQWLRNDVPKIKSTPGMNAMVGRIELAADLLDAAISTHAGCDPAVCPTKWKMLDILNGDEP